MQGFDGHDNPFGNDEINQIFSSLFSNMGMGMGVNGMPGVHFFHSGGGGGVHSFQTHIFNQIQKPPPIVKNIAISLEECYTGCEMTVDVERWINTQNTKITKVEFININIPQGIDSGETITIQNAGHELNDEIRGDVKLIINIINDTQFKRVGNDLFFNKKISLKESLIGFSLNVQHINGKMLYLNNASETSIVIKPNHKKTIPNLGMIKNGVTGNLIIEFEIEYPNMISQEQKNALMGIL
jgi:DnaJ-class molecular chaperone